MPRAARPRRGAQIRSAEDFYREYRDGLYGVLQDAGMVAATWGVTRPLPDVNTPDQLTSGIMSALDEQRVQKGGAAFDGPGTAADQTYAEQRYRFVKEEEGIRRVAYDDATGRSMAPGQRAKGFVTVGIGFNMDRRDAPAVFQNVLGLPRETFQAVYEGRQSLTEPQIRKLFDHTILEAEQIVNNRLGDAPLTQNQRLALVSLAFNNPNLIGPKITRAAREGKIGAALHEILYDSGTQRDPRLKNRRWREAVLYAGGPFSLPPLQEYLKA